MDTDLSDMSLLVIKRDGQEICIATLEKGAHPQHTLDFILDSTTEFVTLGPGTKPAVAPKGAAGLVDAEAVEGEEDEDEDDDDYPMGSDDLVGEMEEDEGEDDEAKPSAAKPGKPGKEAEAGKAGQAKAGKPAQPSTPSESKPNGSAPLASIGNSVAKPPGVSKMAAFIKARPAMFKLDSTGANVSLVKP
ncbi:hypothetical protein HaLaN_06420 [Haematococcus lacustris]|uniref:Nucleoplasmin-like domain-containing protein n=1 Tax=Haematococcus lacustris TaxID=44745 RepID=A0A699YWV4_HAELA|nr:hypothetical protein HaLaN_06420 [Haematococcus lacustris]